MDLGKAKLLRSGLNTLHQAIHPVHGIAWTDGKQVCLTALYFVNDEVTFGDTNVIGQFEHVFGLFWGPLCCMDSPALLAVQHKKHITVWQLQLSALEQNKLLCTQTCEMSEPFPLLPQGCVWHPKLDMLAVLTKRDMSVLFSVRVDNSRIKPDIRGSGLIHCACWTKDGTRLVVAISSALHSFIWNDIEKSLVECSFCPIFDVGGFVCAIEATGEAQVAVTTELPLDKLCRLNSGISFDLPAETETLQGRGSLVVTTDDDEILDSRRQSSVSERSFNPSSGSLDLTHLLAKQRRSDPNPLIHLLRRDTVRGSRQESSHLVLVTYERKVTTTRKVSIPGILAPDIIAFDPRASTVAVASNICSMVLVYSITQSAMPNIQQIFLQDNERPKGVCFLSDKVLLLMVGTQKTTDPAFLPSSNTDKYNLCLISKELIYDGETAIAPSPSALNHESSSNFSAGIRRRSERLSKDDREQPERKDSVLPGRVVSSPGSRRSLIEEIRSNEPSPDTTSLDFSERQERASSRASSIPVENFDVDHVNRMASLAVRGQASRESRASSRASSIPGENFDMDHVNRMASLAVGGQASRDSRAPSRALSIQVENFDMDHDNRMASLAVGGQASRDSRASSIPVENFDMDHVNRMASLAVGGQPSRDSRASSIPVENLDMDHLNRMASLAVGGQASRNSRASSRASSIPVENFDMDHLNRMASLAVGGQASRDSSRSSSPHFEPLEKLHSEPPTLPEKTPRSTRERTLEQLVHNMERLSTRFRDVQQYLSEIIDFTQNGKKALIVYPNVTEPPYVNVTCQKRLSENVVFDEKRPVLLCDGKLCLHTIRDLFNLTTVEMMYGPLWIVLVADADGFVPLTFQPEDELKVRNGKRQSILRTPGTPENSRPNRSLTPGTPENSRPNRSLTPGTPENSRPNRSLTPGTPENSRPNPSRTPGTPENSGPDPSRTPGTPENSGPDPSQSPTTTAEPPCRSS